MAIFFTLCFSSFQPYTKNLTESRRRKGRHGVNDSANVAITALVSKVIRLFNRLPSKTSFLQRSVKINAQQPKTPNEHEKNFSRRMCDIRHSLKKKGISSVARDIISKSWRGSTSKQYEYTWRKWCFWCYKQKINSTSPTEIHVINFLAELFQNKKSYSCINTYKCAISQTLASIGFGNLTNSALIARFMKGIFNLRPPLPRYTFTWDVGKVINFLSTLDPLGELSLKMLTLKCSALLALSTAQRAQTLVNLEIEDMLVNDIL